MGIYFFGLDQKLVYSNMQVVYNTVDGDEPFERACFTKFA